MTTVILYSFVTVAFIQIAYYLYFARFSFAKRNNIAKNSPPVSVIVYIKNDAESLKKNLPSLLQQTDSQFEIVLIDDASYDDTHNIMEDFKKKHSNIKLVSVKNNENFWGNKKYALTLGIKAATHENLLFIDVNCKPISNNWILSMASQFSTEKTIVLGYQKYTSQSQSFTNLLVRYDVLTTAIRCFSLSLLSKPYATIGKNLAYTKSDFFRVKGFINHIQLPFGESNFLIQEAGCKNNTAICYHPDGFTVCESPKNIKTWFHKKRKWFSLVKNYKKRHKIFLGIYFISKLIFWALLPAAFLLLPINWVFATCFSYLLVSYIVIGFSAKKLKEMRVLPFLLFLDLFLVLCQFAIFSANLIQKPAHWK